MDTGKLNRRIQIQSQGTSELDAFQQPLPAAWTTVYRAWANIDIQSSQLIYSTAEFMSKVAHRITIRYTSSVIFTAKQRIVYTEPTTGVTHTYEIEAVLNDKQGNQWLIFMAYELEAAE
jgi:SPP1 family predicted phage head-tail adaptor